MERKTAILPERLCKLDEKMSLAKLIQANLTQETVVAYVERWNSLKKVLEVNFGTNLPGYIPQEEISIYPVLKKDGTTAPELHSLIGRTVCCKVLYFDDNNPVLSRRKNMSEAFDFMLGQQNQTVNGYIKGCIRTAFFIDIGAGLHSMLPIHEYSTARLHSITDLGVNPGEYLNVIIKDFDLDKKQINLGYKENYANGSQYNPNDKITCIILDRVAGTTDGYFCYINPSATGIVNVPETLHIEYGQQVTAVVRSSGEKLRLRFMSLLDE